MHRHVFVDARVVLPLMVFVSLVKSLVKRQRTSERAEESEKRAFGKKRRQIRLHVRTARNCILV